MLVDAGDLAGGLPQGFNGQKSTWLPARRLPSRRRRSWQGFLAAHTINTRMPSLSTVPLRQMRWPPSRPGCRTAPACSPALSAPSLGWGQCALREPEPAPGRGGGCDRDRAHCRSVCWSLPVYRRFWSSWTVLLAPHLFSKFIRLLPGSKISLSGGSNEVAVMGYGTVGSACVK